MRRKRRQQEEVELNLAAMLDMAFQLLAFFIFTFKPAPVEGQVSLHMPPPQPVTQVAGGKSAGENFESVDPLKGLNTLVITALSTPNGELDGMAVGQASVATLTGLDARLKEVLSDPNSIFDQVLVQVGSDLKYQALMDVVDVCTRQKLPNGEPLTKLSFVELPRG